MSKGLWDSISAFAEIPLLCLVAAAVYYGLPESVIFAYKHGLDWAGPILVIVEGIQLTRCITYSGKRIVKLIDDHPENLSIMKGLVVGGSLLCYIICGYLAYNLYISPAMDVSFASFISSALTLLVVLNVLSVFIENGVLTDAALLSLYVLLCCRFALLQSANQLDVMEKAVQNGFLSAIFGNLHIRVNRVFTSDYLLASTLSGVALFTLSFPTEILEEEDIGSLEEEQSIIWQILKDAVYKILGVALYTHLILQLAGHIATYSVLWRIAQVVLCISYYFMSLMQQKYAYHDHYE